MCVCKRGEKGGAAVRAAPPPRLPALPASPPPPPLPAGRGSHHDTAHSGDRPLVRTSGAVGRQGRGPPPAGYFGDIYFFSPVAPSVTAGAPGAARRGSKCSGSMSFGVRGGRRGPRIKAHPINLNFGSAWPAVRGPAGGERFVGAGKANTPPAAGTSQRRGGVCVWRCDKASPR